MNPRRGGGLPPCERSQGAREISDDGALTEAAREYAAAYAEHYSGRDSEMALQLYKKIMASRASAREAGYSRAQVRNIVKAVVPKQELPDARMELALARLEPQISPDAGPVPVAALASEPIE
jgi:hypothetical protein